MHHVGLFSHAAEAHCIQIVHMHGAAPAQHGTPSLATQSMHAVRARPARAKPTRRYRPLLAPCTRAALRAPACAQARRVSRRRRPTVRARAARHARAGRTSTIRLHQSRLTHWMPAPPHFTSAGDAALRSVWYTTTGPSTTRHTKKLVAKSRSLASAAREPAAPTSCAAAGVSAGARRRAPSFLRRGRAAWGRASPGAGCACAGRGWTPARAARGREPRRRAR